MKEFVITEAKVETAVIVGLITPQQNERKTMEYLNELEFLADTAGAKVIRSIAVVPARSVFRIFITKRACCKI